QDVVLGFDNIRQYADTVNTPSDFGAAIGRYANRIKNGQITIDGQTIQLPKNNFGHCLHGGPSGWQYQVYEANQPAENMLQLTMKSPDGDNNFPGNVTAIVTYTVTNDNGLDIAYTATTDKKTVINMTNHSYFNLNGDPNVNIENHLLQVNAYIYTPSDETYMTTGDTVWVKGTPMDFLELKEIGKEVNNVDYKPIKNANGFDHNWCLASYANGKGNDKLVSCTLYSPITGIKMDVYTNEPGVQVYTGNFLDGSATGKKGIAYQKRAGICLETQKYPDSPNKKGWPSAYLAPGEKYYSHCLYKFSVAK
ncbi:MAG: galactose mutarotase, partial [Prevotella sp.]|nr:galactose mutarotase [Prevotella sp.]